MECSNYRTCLQALTSHLGKVLMIILTERLRSQVEEHMADKQAGFRKDRSTVQLSHAALDRQRWAAIVTMASDINGR